MIIKVPAIDILTDGMKTIVPKYLTDTQISWRVAEGYEHPINFQYYYIEIIDDPNNEVNTIINNVDVEIIR